MNKNNQLQIRTEILLYISFPGHQTKDLVCSFSPLLFFSSPVRHLCSPSFFPSPSLFFSSSSPFPPFLFPSLSLLFSPPLLCCLVITDSDNVHFLQPLPGLREALIGADRCLLISELLAHIRGRTTISWPQPSTKPMPGVLFDIYLVQACISFLASPSSIVSEHILGQKQLKAYIIPLISPKTIFFKIV